MQTFYRRLVPFLLSLCACACSSVAVTDYQDLEPAIDLEEFFNGNLTAHGVVKNRSGRVIRLFNADIQASWDNGTGVLDEYFTFNDGEQQQRIWQLQPDEKDTYTATAGDVRGKGRLTRAGNSVFLDYVLTVPYGQGTIDVRVDDRMYQVSPGVLINESQLSKFGVRVGSILLVILRQEDSGAGLSTPH